jgi:hypothetical protein
MGEVMFWTLWYIRTSRLSEIIFTGILESDDLPIMFTILSPGRRSKTLYSFEKLMNRELFQRLDSELVSPNKQIYSSNEADKAARDFPASIASS